MLVSTRVVDHKATHRKQTTGLLFNRKNS